MVTIRVITEALQYLKGTIVGKYIGGERVFLTNTKLDEAYEKLTYVNDTLKYVAGFEKLKFSLFIRTKYSEIVDIKFDMVFKVDGGHATQKCNITVPRNGFDYICEYMRQYIADFEECELTIDRLNSEVQLTQKNFGYKVEVRYCADYIHQSGAYIKSWDYTHMIIALSMDLVKKVTALGNIQPEVNAIGTYYGNSLKQLLIKFNKSVLHSKIGAKLTGNVKSVLEQSCKSMGGTIAYIMRNRMKNESQVIYSCTFIEDNSGCFMALCKWNVDYGIRKINIELCDNTVYDLGNDKMIHDGEVYDDIKRMVQLPECRSPIVFGDMTVEEFLNM